jgi:hypothetical protein
MFKITSKQPIIWSWASFKLVKGENTFPSRASVPTELWPKLERFRTLGLVEFEAEFKDGKLVAHESDTIVLEQLSEQQLYQMSKADLAELAKANGVDVQAAEGAKEPSKKLLLDALVAKLPKPPAPPAEEAAQAVASTKRGGRKPAADSPVISDTDVRS